MVTINQLSQGQDFLNWTHTIGSMNEEIAKDMVVDDDENIYIVGDLFGTVNMNPTGNFSISPPVGNLGVYVAKYDKTGAFQWAIALDADSGSDITLNSSGSVLITGTFTDTATFGTFTIRNTISSTTSTIYVASFDKDTGAFQGAAAIEGSGDQQALDIKPSGSSILLAGTFTGTADFDITAAQANEVQTGSVNNLFIAQLDNQASLTWVKSIASNSTNNIIDDIEADAAGNIYAVGRRWEALDFQNGTNQNGAVGQRPESFIFKTASDGSFEWSHTGSHTGSSSRSGYYSLEFDGNGDITVAGFLEGSVLLGGFTSNTLSTGFSPDILIVKYAPDGTAISQHLLGGESQQFALVHAIDAQGNYIISGVAQGGNNDFDPDENGVSNIGFSSTNQFDVFVAKYNSDLTFQWAGGFLGSGLNDWVHGLAASPSGNIYMSGYVQDDVDFDFDATNVQQNGISGGRDLYIASLHNVAVVNQNINLCDGTTVQVGGNTYDAIGSYQDVFTGGRASGQDSVVNTTILSLLDPITLTTTATSPTCFGGNDGAVTINASDAATRDYQYSINGVTSQVSPTFTGLVAGTYTVWVEDKDDCVASINFQLQAISEITATATITAPFCHGDAFGIIAVNATGGSGTYTYSIDGVNFQTSASFIEYPAGQYTITIKDSNNCTATISATITQPDLLQLFEDTLVDPACGGEATGLIDVAAIGGTSPYEYSIDGTNFGTSHIFDNLEAGSYTVTVRDAKGCSTTLSRTLTAPDVLVPNFGKVDLSCNGDNSGEITGMATGGVGPYSFSLDGTNFQTGTFNNLAAGDYTLTVKDTNNCTATISVTINEPTVFNVIADKTDVTCNGADDGTITLFASGGTTGGGSIFINNVATTSSSFTGLPAGTYDFRVLDANMCEVSLTVTITEPDVLALTATTTNITCNGDADGQLALTAAGGTAPYEYSLDGGDFQAAASFTSLAPASYSITVRDTNGCTAMTTSTVTEPAVLSLAFEKADITCNGANDGQIGGAAIGGTAPYSYSIDGTDFQTGAFSSLAPGSYTLTAKDANDCTTTASVIIAEPDALAVSTTKTDISCNGLEDGTISVSSSGGTAPYILRVNDVVQASNALTGMAPGSYNVKITDANLCEVTEIVVVDEPVALSLTAAATNVTCNGDADGQITLTPTGGTAPFEYSLDGTTFQSAASFISLAPESYTITVRDANGCTSTATATISEPDAIVVVVNLINFNTITASALGGTAPYEYAIDGTFQSSGIFSNLGNGDYTVTVRDANGCTQSAPLALVVTSGEEPLIATTVRSYPNPAKDYVLISEVASGDIIRLVSLSGKTMSQTDIQIAQRDYRQDISAIREGMFVLVITDKSGRRKLSQKVMRVK